MLHPIARLLFGALTLVSSARGAPLDYRPLPLSEVIVRADVIVAGEIVDLGEETYTLRADRWIAGETEADTLVLARFGGWTCAGRFGDYAVGQRLVVFARTTSDDRLGPLGAGNEGEHPLLGDEAFLVRYRVRGIPEGEVELVSMGTDVEVPGTRVGLDELTEAAQGLRAIASLLEKPRKASSGPHMGLVAPQSEVAAYAKTSALAAHLVREVELLVPLPAARSEGLPKGASFSMLDLWRLAYPEAEPEEGLDRQSCGGLVLLGDLDGDGAEDYAIGTPGAEKLAGAVWIVLAGPNGLPKAAHRLGSAAFGTRANPLRALGNALVALGDVNGDGVPDMLVSAPLTDGAEKRAGALLVLCLGPDGSLRESWDLMADAPVRAWARGGTRTLEKFCAGDSLGMLGDMDGDGTREVLVMSTFMLLGPRDREVGTLLFSLDAKGHVARCRGLGALAMTGPGRLPLGVQLGAGGDLDGDGQIELVHSNPSYGDRATRPGRLVLLSAPADARARPESFTPQVEFSSWSGPTVGELRHHERFGSFWVCVGDVNGDGRDDLCAVSRGALWLLGITREEGPVAKSLVAPWDVPYNMAVAAAVGEGGYLLIAGAERGRVRVIGLGELAKAFE